MTATTVVIGVGPGLGLSNFVVQSAFVRRPAKRQRWTPSSIATATDGTSTPPSKRFNETAAKQRQ